MCHTDNVFPGLVIDSAVFCCTTSWVLSNLDFKDTLWLLKSTVKMTRDLLGRCTPRAYTTDTDTLPLKHSLIFLTFTFQRLSWWHQVTAGFPEHLQHEMKQTNVTLMYQHDVLILIRRFFPLDGYFCQRRSPSQVEHVYVQCVADWSPFVGLTIDTWTMVGMSIV